MGIRQVGKVGAALGMLVAGVLAGETAAEAATTGVTAHAPHKFSSGGKKYIGFEGSWTNPSGSIKKVCVYLERYAMGTMSPVEVAGDCENVAPGSGSLSPGSFECVAGIYDTLVLGINSKGVDQWTSRSYSVGYFPC